MIPLSRLHSLTPVRPICCHCGQTMRPGEPHWAGDAENRPWHYGCAEKAGLTIAWSRLRRRRPSQAATGDAPHCCSGRTHRKERP